MNSLLRIGLLLAMVLLGTRADAEPALRVVRSSSTGGNLLRNGDFEMRDGAPGLAGWSRAERGFRVASGEGRSGSVALGCKADDARGWHGASQSISLNRTNAVPLVIRGWSRAEAVSGSPDSGYSLYVDLVYADGTPLWGQTGDFRCGTHDWEPREFVIMPEKPVKTLTLHCILRGHSGSVWFDDVAVTEVKAEGNAVVFQGVPVEVVFGAKRPEGALKRAQIAGDLRIGLAGDRVESFAVGSRELAGNAPSGFMVRDVAAESDFLGFEGGQCRELGLALESRWVAKGGAIALEGRISDLGRRDRAVTLVFALPIDAQGWQWGDDIHRSRRVEGNGEFANVVGVRCGSTGTQSLYPVAGIWDDRTGIALGLDMAQPAQYRLAYHAGTRQFLIAFDFGLVPETERFPQSADFRFVMFAFDSRWGFRSAFDRYMALFPEHFEVRARDQGIWMPFTDVGTVDGWRDFGFKFHEGNNAVPFDDANGILSFRYTEPMTWWMPMAPGRPRTEPEALKVRDELLQSGSGTHRAMAEVSQLAAMWDEDGAARLVFRNEPWCNGAVWSLNPNPFLPGGVNAGTTHWSDAIRERLYGPDAKGQLDGEYLDSLEGYVTAELNFRREHFRHSTVPLTFASDTKRPALFKGLAVAEFTRWIAQDVHRLGKLMFANGVPYRFTYLCPWLDVMGTETDWLRGGRYQPVPDAQLSLWRTMSGRKPYVLLMNTDYDVFTPEMVEKYFDRSLACGFFPSMFSHNAAENPYWKNPKWYNRDRPLFLKYIPLIKRIAEAGWQPVTRVRSDNAKLSLERFGPDSSGRVWVTVFNDTLETQQGLLRIEPELVPKGEADAIELISGRKLERVDGLWTVRMGPQKAALIEWRAAGR